MDLDDSDDERMTRQRQKQREFAKMRTALLADEKIGEIAENPKKQAFFKAIEDRDSEDEMDLDFEEPNSEDVSSQDVQPDTSQDNAPAREYNRGKRPLEPSAADAVNRPPPHLRRTAASTVSRKPSTLADIRETVSFLLETPEYDSFREDASLDNDEDAGPFDSDQSAHADEAFPSTASTSNHEFAIPRNPRRSHGRVVDRLALLRAASSNSASASSNSKLAFQPASTKDQIPNIGFRPPPLLHRNTSSSSTFSLTSSSASSSVRTTTGPPAGPSNAKKGAVNYYTAARERERERELRIKQRDAGSNIVELLCKQKAAGAGGLGKLIASGKWE
jgi:mediator of replication checkpoint protein 1